MKIKKTSLRTETDFEESKQRRTDWIKRMSILDTSRITLQLRSIKLKNSLVYSWTTPKETKLS
jgi:hypothetical protein